MSDWSPEKQAQVKKNWMNIRERAGEMAMLGVKHLERQRDEAKARGDQVEFERLDQLIRTQREQAEKMLRAQQAANPGAPGLAPEGQAEPPLH
jgi:parvulin-like peptidyl-prolyl isomerase